METAAFTLFDTAIGRCGIGWRAGRVCAFALPGADDAATAAALRRRCPDAGEAPADGEIARAIAAVRALLAGNAADLGFIEVDLAGVPAFEKAVYAQLRTVPPGATITYGELAQRCGSPGAARAVGAAMGRNPVPVIIPCHRVLASGGRSGGFSAPGGVTTKLRILQIEQGKGAGASLLFDHLPLAVAPARA